MVLNDQLTELGINSSKLFNSKIRRENTIAGMLYESSSQNISIDLKCWTDYLNSVTFQDL